MKLIKRIIILKKVKLQKILVLNQSQVIKRKVKTI